ncbi:MAG: hypothetical protein JWM91_2899, partial [Rhodospirillales bacterium]|nr:hypothetical protein [Rhodospirillales bacterium]
YNHCVPVLFPLTNEKINIIISLFKVWLLAELLC